MFYFYMIIYAQCTTTYYVQLMYIPGNALFRYI